MRKKLTFIILVLFTTQFLWNPVKLIIDKMQGKETIGSIQKRLEQKRGLDFKRLFGELPQIKKIQIIGIKKNRLLEVWVKRDNLNGDAFVKLAEYEFTNYSGIQGPKLMRGDRQIPEGFYGIEYLNPNSKFYLSLKLTFPNAFDLEMGKNDNRNDLGGDIFIHGKNVTIGCIPIGDKNIEELFYLVSKVGKENTRVLISPVDFRKNELPEYCNEKCTWINSLYKELRDSLNLFKE